MSPISCRCQMFGISWNCNLDSSVLRIKSDDYKMQFRVLIEMKREATDAASHLLTENTFHVNWNLLGGNHELTLMCNRLNSRQ